jgi:serine/threonine protein kinase
MDEERIFLRAVEFDNADERAAYLNDACGNDCRLRTGVESLLKHHAAAGNFLDAPPKELQKTFGSCDGDTVESGSTDRLLEMLAPCDKPGRIGQLGPYEIIEVIGRGGMGVIVRACDPKLNRNVAIKLLAAAGRPSPGALKRFLREAQATAAVDHDHVVTIHAVNDDGPLPFIVMELVEGISLQQKIDRDGALELGDILRIGSQIAAGLDAAHQCGLIHRDIKPANILLESGTQRVKITDFGLARTVEDGSLSCEGQIAGTPQFMSPEQAQGQTADQRSDLFSLGSVLYTMCTGRPAFPAETAVASLRGICDDAPRPIRECNMDVPEWLDEIICRLLEKDPSHRPQNAREVAELLGAKLAKLQASSSSALPAVEGIRTVHPRRNRWRSVGLATASAIVLAGVVIVIVIRDGQTTRIEVPVGAKVRVTSDRVVEVDLPDDRRETNGSTAILPVPRPVKEVAARLAQLNPGFDGRVTPTISNGDIVGLEFDADHVTDISPVTALRTLRSLVCAGSARETGQLSDLSPLRGLTLRSLDCANTQVSDLTPLRGMPLQKLNCANTNVADLSPLKEMPLTDLYLQGTRVTDLSPLRGMVLKHLNCSFTRVTDLSALQGMRLVAFYCDSTRVADLSPLLGMPLTTLNWRGYNQTDLRHQKVVRSITTLEVIDSLPTDEFWRAINAKRRD